MTRDEEAIEVSSLMGFSLLTPVQEFDDAKEIAHQLLARAYGYTDD